MKFQTLPCLLNRLFCSIFTLYLDPCHVWPSWGTQTDFQFHLVLILLQKLQYFIQKDGLPGVWLIMPIYHTGFKDILGPQTKRNPSPGVPSLKLCSQHQYSAYSTVQYIPYTTYCFKIIWVCRRLYNSSFKQLYAAHYLDQKLREDSCENCCRYCFKLIHQNGNSQMRCVISLQCTKVFQEFCAYR